MSVLYLLPTPLGERETSWLLPEDEALIRPLRRFIVESEKTARRHLKLLSLDCPLRELSMTVLDEHTPAKLVPEFLRPLLEGHDAALMSEAGCPAVADPGALLVAEAHRRGIAVRPLVGPSSLILALMASGANGQRFVFHGYLPASSEARQGSLKRLQARARSGESQLFIETPYRNLALLRDITATLSDDMMVCVAADLTLPSQIIISRSVAAWKKSSLPELHKRPCVFVLFEAT